MDRLTFKCTDCGHPVEVEGVPAESDLVICRICGRKFGTLAEVKNAMIELGKAELAFLDH
jgi:hypothetical protein